jgi:hypothetical protein
MKKLYFLLLIAVINNNVTCGQSTKFGGGLTFGTGFHYNNESAGIDADLYRAPLTGLYFKGIIETKSPIQISPSFIYFIPRTNNVPDLGTMKRSTKVSEMIFDLNGHYVFYSPNRLTIYGLSGINITLTKLKWLDGSFSPGLDNALGLNLGTGTLIKISEKIDFNAEIKYSLGKYHQLLINAGILFNLSWLNRNP